MGVRFFVMLKLLRKKSAMPPPQLVVAWNVKNCEIVFMYSVFSQWRADVIRFRSQVSVIAKMSSRLDIIIILQIMVAFLFIDPAIHTAKESPAKWSGLIQLWMDK